MRCGKRRPWRHNLAQPGRTPVLRACLVAVFILECTYGVTQFPPLIKTENSMEVEWIIPEEGDLPEAREIYGIQFRLEEGEVRVYRKQQEINDY